MRSFSKPFALSLATFGLVACVSFPYPMPDEQIGLRQRIDRCFLAVPVVDAFALSSYATVPSLRYPAQCEVWYKFEKFGKAIGLSEQYAASSGQAVRYEYDYMFDVLTRSIDFTPSAEVLIRGEVFRSVTSTARVTGMNGTLTAEVKTIWKKHSLGWDLEPLDPKNFEDAVLSGSVDGVVEPEKQILCRLTQSATEEVQVCRDETGRWVVVPLYD